MTDATNRPHYWERQTFTDDGVSMFTEQVMRWHPFRIVAAAALLPSAYGRGEIVTVGEPSDEYELTLLNMSYCELVATNVTTQPGYNAVAHIGPDKDGVLPWLVQIEEDAR